jgi:YfiR/HmsC-like
MRIPNRIVLSSFFGGSRGWKLRFYFWASFACGLACCCLLDCLPTYAQEAAILRYKTEANFLANFASFVEWPSSAFHNDGTPIQICVFSNLEFANSIRELTKDHKPHGRRIEVLSLKKNERYTSCHILFIGREDADRYEAILGQLRDSPVLTVGETPNFPDAGGIVNFVLGESLQIDINAGAAERAHLKIRATLEAIARHVTNLAKVNEHGQPSP